MIRKLMKCGETFYGLSLDSGNLRFGNSERFIGNFKEEEQIELFSEVFNELIDILETSEIQDINEVLCKIFDVNDLLYNDNPIQETINCELQGLFSFKDNSFVFSLGPYEVSLGCLKSYKDCLKLLQEIYELLRYIKNPKDEAKDLDFLYNTLKMLKIANAF